MADEKDLVTAAGEAEMETTPPPAPAPLPAGDPGPIPEGATDEQKRAHVARIHEWRRAKLKAQEREILEDHRRGTRSYNASRVKKLRADAAKLIAEADRLEGK